MNRIDYSALMSVGGGASPFAAGDVSERLCDAWCADYQHSFRDAEIVSIALDRFSYLFDLTHERTLAAYGIMGDVAPGPRDKARMARYYKKEGREYHRGHMIPHSGGGGTDINLFIQNGAVNTGRLFRELESKAVANPGSFYFVRLIYGSDGGIRPAFVEQGLLANATPATIEARFFAN